MWELTFVVLLLNEEAACDAAFTAFYFYGFGCEDVLFSVR